MTFKNREELFNYYENYSGNRKEELVDNKTVHPLLKSYIIETFRDGAIKQNSHNPFSELPDVLLGKQIDETLYPITIFNKEGFLEKISPRFWIFYSTKKSSELDNATAKLIKQSTLLDHLWISGKLYNVFWNSLLSGREPYRFIRMSFEFDDYFSKTTEMPEDQDLDNDDYADINEKRISRIGFTEQKERIEKILPELQNLLPSFYVTSLLRFPSGVGGGGHDFYYSGKVTNRSDSFRDHRNQIVSICDIYEKITNSIENEVWFGVEKNNLKVDGHFYNLKGMPVNIVFQKELSLQKFNAFITTTFEKKMGPFRLWGQPIRLSEKLVHVYGADMHLWQEIYLEMSTKQFTIILPEGTCGNTVHRLVTNIQRYLEPEIKVWIGEQDYDVLSSNVAVGSDGL